MKLKYRYHIYFHYLLDDGEQMRIAQFGARTASRAKYKYEQELKWLEKRGASIVKSIIYKDVTEEVLEIEKSSITEEL